MPNQLGTAAIGVGAGAASGLLGAGMGLLLEGHNDRRQLKQQGKLQDLQIQGEKQMTDYNMSKQLQMWKDTSYQAQKEQMQKAGINPALMYGMGGGGGQSMGTPNANVTGAEAPKGGGEAMAGMGIMSNAQLALMNAQKENIEADTANKKAETGVKEVQKPNIEIDTYGKQIQNTVAAGTIEARIQQETEKLGILESQNKLDANTRLDKQLQIANQAIQTGLENIGQDVKNEQLREQINKTKQDIKESIARIAQGWKDLDLKEVDLAIKQFLAEYTANHPELGKVIGGTIQRIAAAFGKPNNEVKVQK